MSLNPILESSLGLTEKESAVYLALLESGMSTVKPIADKSGVKRTSIYNFINRLVELGAVNKSIIRGRKYFEAVDPECLLEIAKRRVEDLEENIKILQSIKKESERKIRVQYYEGPNEVKNILLEESRCKREALYIWTGKQTMEMIGGSSYMAKIDKQRIEKGVRIRTIRSKKKDITFSTSSHGDKYLREIRFAPPFFDVSMTIGLYDTGKVSLISSKEEGFGVMIESFEFFQIMKLLHDLLWKQCIPAKEGEG